LTMNCGRKMENQSSEKLVTIRIAEEKDKNKILELLKNTPELSGIGELENSIYTDNFVSIYILDKENHLILVAEQSEKIIGILLADFLAGYSYLADLVVLPEHRRKGIATKLLSIYELKCKEHKMDKIAGLVQQENRRMQDYLEKKDYKKGKTLIQYQKEI
jgi:ribosomal protein S18 acetylase RimI-like enzyme